MRKVGFTFNPDDYSPKMLGILSLFESEFNKLEAKELDKARKKSAASANSKPSRPRRRR